jgi:hypothetical protein
MLKHSFYLVGFCLLFPFVFLQANDGDFESNGELCEDLTTGLPRVQTGPGIFLCVKDTYSNPDKVVVCKTFQDIIDNCTAMVGKSINEAGNIEPIDGESDKTKIIFSEQFGVRPVDQDLELKKGICGACSRGVFNLYYPGYEAGSETSPFTVANQEKVYSYANEKRGTYYLGFIGPFNSWHDHFKDDAVKCANETLKEVVPEGELVFQGWRYLGINPNNQGELADDNNSDFQGNRQLIYEIVELCGRQYRSNGSDHLEYKGGGESFKYNDMMSCVKDIIKKIQTVDFPNVSSIQTRARLGLDKFLDYCNQHQNIVQERLVSNVGSYLVNAGSEYRLETIRRRIPGTSNHGSTTSRVWIHSDSKINYCMSNVCFGPLSDQIQDRIGCPSLEWSEENEHIYMLRTGD